MFFHPADAFDEVDGIAGMFGYTSSHGQDVQVENDVTSRETAICQQVVGPLGNSCLTVNSRGLAFFVEGHDDNGSTEMV